MSEILDLLREVVVASDRVRHCVQSWADDNHGVAPAAHRLANLTLEIASQASIRAKRKIAGLTSGGEVDIESVRALYAHVDSCNELFEIIEHSSRRSLHPVLSPMVQAQLEALEIPGDVLVTSVRDISYELDTYSARRYEKLVSTSYLYRFLQTPLHVFRIPHPPTDWPMYHVLLYHEIGHAAFLARGGIKEFVVPDELQPKSENAQQLLSDRDRQQYYETCANRWYEELFADAIGLELVGPGFLLAFCRVLGGGCSLNAANDIHPPTGLRILLMLNSLASRGILDQLPLGARSIFTSWHRALKEIDIRRQYVVDVDGRDDQILRIIIDFLVNTMREIYEFLRSQVRKIVPDYTIEKLQLDLQRGSLLHKLHIPPIETNKHPGEQLGVPLESPEIFAACWAAYMLSLDGDKNSTEGLERALLESLDASQSLRTWRTTK